ncbi:uncharacterized protein LOC144543597 [Carex rostrata]
MNRVKFAPLRSIEGAQQQSLSAALFRASCSFHSTAALEKKRRTQWNYGFNYYGKRRKNRNGDSKRALFRNMSDYAELLFQSWREEEERKPISRRSWFRNHHWVRGTDKTSGFNPHGPQNSANFDRKNGIFDSSSSDDDEEVETIFRSTFGGRFTYWSFDRSNSTYRNFHNRSRDWSYDSDEDEDETFDRNKTKSEMALAKKTLGLSISGPLKLEEVKSAYRTCALRWHPDRHHGSSKVEAEEKFKNCSAAYKTLCDSLI